MTLLSQTDEDDEVEVEEDQEREEHHGGRERRQWGSSSGLTQLKISSENVCTYGRGRGRSCARGREVIWPGVRKTAVGQSESADRDKSKSHGHCRTDKQGRTRRRKS